MIRVIFRFQYIVNMRKYWLLLLIGTLLFVLLDALVLPLLSKYVMQQHLGPILKPNINRLAAGITRFLLSAGILIFVITSTAVQDAWDAASMGMMFGLIVYGVYECTNMAMLKHRHWNVVLVDIARGMILCALVGFAMWRVAGMLALW